jgi:hypothetical protein
MSLQWTFEGTGRDLAVFFESAGAVRPDALLPTGGHPFGCSIFRSVREIRKILSWRNLFALIALLEAVLHRISWMLSRHWLTRASE